MPARIGESLVQVEFDDPVMNLREYAKLRGFDRWFEIFAGFILRNKA